MACHLPEDFGTKWAMSDIVLNTINADGRELYASKHVLATHSPFYQAMFFGADWAEKSSDFLDLDDDYDVVKEALKIMYNVGRSYDSVALHSPKDLFDLYIFADKRDIPMIRQMCEVELAAQPNVEALGVSARLGLHDVTAKLLNGMDKSTIEKLVSSTLDDEMRFNGNELKIVIEKIKTEVAKSLSALTAKNNETQTLLKLAAAQLKANINELVTKNTAMNTAHNEKVRKLESETVRLKGENGRLEREKDRLKDDKDLLEIKNSRLGRENNRLEDEVKDLKDDLFQSETLDVVFIIYGCNSCGRTFKAYEHVKYCKRCGY